MTAANEIIDIVSDDEVGSDDEDGNRTLDEIRENMSETIPDDTFAFLRLVMRGDVDGTRKMLEGGYRFPEDDDLLSEIEMFSIHPLQISAKKGNVDMMRLLDEYEFDFSVRTEDGTDLLALCTGSRSVNSIPYLVYEKSFDPTHCELGGTRIQTGIQLANYKALIDCGANLSFHDNYSGYTAMHLACMNSNKAYAEELISRGVDVNAKDNMGRTPIFYARNASIVRLLHKNGADFGIKDKDGILPSDAIKKDNRKLYKQVESFFEFEELSKGVHNCDEDYWYD